MGQERQTRRRQHRLGRRQRQRPQPGALTADQNDGVHLRGIHAVRRRPFACLRRELRTTRPARAARAALIVHRSGACHQPRMPISQESVGAGVMGRQVAGRIPTRRVPLVVQNLRRRHVHVLPARPAEAITQVDVLHVHEIPLVEARHLIESGPPQQQARARQPADGAFAGLLCAPAGRRPSTGWISRTVRPRRACRRGSGSAGAAPTGRPSRRDRGSAVRAHPARGQRAAASSSTSMLRGPPLHVGVGDDEELRVTRSRSSRYSATARFTAVP